MQPLSRAELAALAGCGEERMAELERLGLIGAADAAFDRGDISRLRLIVALGESGIPLEVLADAMVRDGLSLGFAREIMFDLVSLSQTRLETVLERTGLDLADLNRLRASTGLSALTPGQVLRDDDIELAETIAECRALGASDAALSRVLRTFGQSVRRIVETMRDLFRNEVEDRMLDAGIPYERMLEISAERRLALQRAGFRTLFMLQRRMLEDAVFDNVVMRLQQALRERGHHFAVTETLPAVAFADLTGFTGLTHAIGDAKAAEQASVFEALAQDLAAAHGGTIVKPLGDGVMMHFPDASSGIAACLALIAEGERAGLPRVRAGVATGQVVPRDGDIFGSTVNLAARLTEAAAPAQLLACATTQADALAAAPGRFAFAALEPALFKGMRDPVPLFAVTGASG